MRPILVETMAATRLLILLLVTAALAGCADDEAEGPSDLETGEDTTDADGTDGDTSEEVPAVPEDPVTEPWYFTADGGLQNTTPDDGSVNAALSPLALLVGFETVEFHSAPLEEPMLVHNEAMTATIFLQSDAPMASNHAFDVAVWGGSTLGMPLLSLTTHGAVETPGEPIEITLTLDFDGQRGIFVPAGESLRFIIATNFAPGEESDAQHVVVGGDTASHVTLTRQDLGDTDPLAGAKPVDHEVYDGQVTHAFTPIDCDTMPGTTSMEFTVPVSEDAVGIKGALEATSGHGGVTDLDLDLYDGSTLIASGHTPHDDERFFLVGLPFEGLAGRELTAKVSTCGQGPIDFELTVTEWTLPDLEAALD